MRPLPKEEASLYIRAINAWGEDAQKWMLVEELGELLVALNKTHRAWGDDYDEAMDELFGELADVQIMVEQIIVLFQARREVADWRAQKLSRLKDRLDVWEAAQ